MKTAIQGCHALPNFVRQLYIRINSKIWGLSWQGNRHTTFMLAHIQAHTNAYLVILCTLTWFNVLAKNIMKVFPSSNIEQLQNNHWLQHLRGRLFIPSGHGWETLPLRAKPMALLMKAWAFWRKKILKLRQNEAKILEFKSQFKVGNWQKVLVEKMKTN